MGRIAKKTIEELEEIFDRGCEYAGTEETVHEVFLESMDEIGACGDWDEMTVKDMNDNEIALQVIIEGFYDNMIEKVMNVLRSQY